MESVKNVSACDWPKFAGRLTRPQSRSAGQSSVLRQGSAQLVILKEALACQLRGLVSLAKLVDIFNVSGVLTKVEKLQPGPGLY